METTHGFSPRFSATPQWDIRLSDHDRDLERIQWQKMRREQWEQDLATIAAASDPKARVISENALFRAIERGTKTA